MHGTVHCGVLAHAGCPHKPNAAKSHLYRVERVRVVHGELVVARLAKLQRERQQIKPKTGCKNQNKKRALSASPAAAPAPRCPRNTFGNSLRWRP